MRLVGKWRIVVLFIIMLMVVIYIYWQKTTPIRIIKTFIYAVERQDVDMIYRLTIPEEREKLGVTTKSIRLVLEATLWRHSQIVGSIQGIEVYSYYAVAFGEWLDAITKKPIPANYGPVSNPGRMVLIVNALALTSEGWRVSTARFLVGRDFQTFGNLNLCRKAGLRGLVDVRTGHVVTLEEIERWLTSISVSSR